MIDEKNITKIELEICFKLNEKKIHFIGIHKNQKYLLYFVTYY